MEQGTEEDDDAVEDDKLDIDDPNAIIAKAGVADDEYQVQKGASDKNYYGIAHTLREPVEKQPSMLAFGTLKEYQVCLSLSL